MKLVAVKKISQRRPLGAVFEESGRRAKLLVKLGLATPHDEPSAPATPSSDAPAQEPVVATEPEPVFMPTSRARHGRRPGAHG